MTAIQETAAAKNPHPQLHNYYFYTKREMVVARNPMFAAAFYADRHGYESYTFLSQAELRRSSSLYSDPQDDPNRIGAVVAVMEYYGEKTEICRGYVCADPEGTFAAMDWCAVPFGSFPPGYFQELIIEAQRDTAYEPKDEPPSHMFDDILSKLKMDFNILTEDQLVYLAQVIVGRRDNGDIWPTLEYIVKNHYYIYLDHMHPIIRAREWAFHDQLDDLLFEEELADVARHEERSHQTA
jgi:hypothetical protein